MALAVNSTDKKHYKEMTHDVLLTHWELKIYSTENDVKGVIN